MVGLSTRRTVKFVIMQKLAIDPFQCHHHVPSLACSGLELLREVKLWRAGFDEDCEIRRLPVSRIFWNNNTHLLRLD